MCHLNTPGELVRGFFQMKENFGGHHVSTA